ncbi:DUF2919 domain-containing protein [Psychromonas ossibalaenae]|uniref:DUF2919 domain-containing protein n=1 Tax=Psychromonas ossibalaenae TaxID=444922 RepID=UPI00037A5DEF|nr:DUF2919 domain-containing protein [Psychromonas ossibalaenae]
MSIRLYPLQHYTQSGNLKPPPFFYLALLFLARTWGLLIISVVSRNEGEKLLAMFYPDKIHFYSGLASGAVAVTLFILSGRDHDKNRIISKLWQTGYVFLLLSILTDLGLQFYYLLLNNFQYSLAASIQLVFALWLLLYCCRSKHLKDCFVRTI